MPGATESADPMMAVRAAQPDDGESIAAIYAPIVRDTSVSFETEPPSGAVMAERIRSTISSHPYLVAERAGEVVGYAYASKHRERAAYRWSVDVTVYVALQARRTGVGRALYGPLLSILRTQGFHSAFAGIALPNAGSVGLHVAMGFVPVGIYRNVGFKHGRWHSVGWWGLELVEGVETPTEPLPLSSVDLAAHLLP
ncbi:GNAT family N-acetyltransferase [Devosia sp. ZB163]|uniref:arsinothricin resistance N-acetyltransferase ArsN1 family B n=1 Tax=Devosia sp. ZB163 TaxID=3025938 RepID=UPI002360994B|nr:arsinothricin resistance N-acetyltransferase ArsN1 family B [Devosia sp. ZB163]MDC9823976.1 GNAT family N-acetyltransferase [Devosia sp. ZB163]